jgi:DNA repair exonuclease SbcCD ATPase subunit
MTAHLDLLRRITELEAENERLRAQRNKAYAESDTNHAGMVAAQEDAMKMRERTRALEAALVTLMVAPTNHENADTSREYNSAWEAARDTLGFNPFEHRRQAALTEPTPPQEEPR